MHSGRSWWYSPALVVLAVAACGEAPASGGGGGADAGSRGDGSAEDELSSIVVEPGDETFVIDGDEPASVNYTATAVYEDGSQRDVTDEARFSLGDGSLGRFEGGAFESFTTRGGTTRVSARLGGLSGSTQLTLVLRKRHSDPDSEDDLPENPGEAFEGEEEPEGAPQLVYPNDGVLVPPNLRELELHFLPGEGERDLFELNFENHLTDISVYFRCTEEVSGGCVYEPDPQLWTWLAESNRGAGPVEVTLRATDDEGSGVGVSEPIDVRFSFDDVRGAIYYWTTSGDTAIMSYDFGSRSQEEAEVVLEPSDLDASPRCVGCHALSPDGTKMVSELNGQRDGRLSLFDLEKDEPMGPVSPGAQSIFQSWNPEGSEFVGVYMDNGATDYNLLLFDGETAERTGRIDIGATADEPANHPDWSPDGSRIVFSRPDRPGTNQRSHHGSIQMVTYEGDDAWSDPETLVPREESTNYYYPAFSPDPDYIIFNRSRCEEGNTGDTHECDGDMNPTATLMMMRAEPGAEPVELSQANAPGVMDEGETKLYNSFPKWSPFEFQRTEEFSSRLQWVTFSSKRQYGLRETDTLLWMVGIDPDQVRSGRDPSFPAFAIPYQDLDTNNHIAQWTESSVEVE